MINKIYIKSHVFCLVLFLFVVVSSYSQIPEAILTTQHTSASVKNEKLTILRSYEILINNRDGDKYAEVSIPYSKLNKVSNVEAFIKDIHGTIIKKLKASEITARSEMQDFSLFEDNYVKEFTLIHNVYPYTICYQYEEQQSSFLYIDDWTPVINREVPTLNATLSLEVPKHYKINYYSQHIDSLKTDTLENTIKYTWHTKYTTLPEPEIYSPYISNYYPTVLIVPEKFNYDKSGSFKTWKEYGNWQYSLLTGLNVLPESEKMKINSLISGVTDKKEIVKILFHYLQDETRYVNVTIETGGMKPYSADYVAINKYGDCKALTNYFKSLLNYVGIYSVYATVYAGDVVKKINLQFPSQQFNHVILCVPLQSSDSLWLDCTSDGPFNHLGTFTQNRKVFLVENNNSHFTNTPKLSKESVLASRNIKIRMDSANKMIAKFSNTYKGEYFDALSDVSKSFDESSKSKVVVNHLIEKGFAINDYKIKSYHRDSDYISLNYSATNERLFQSYGNEQLIKIIPFSLPYFKNSKVRKFPVQLNYPINNSDTLEYDIPAGYNISSMPKNVSFNTIYGGYDAKFEQKDHQIKVVKNFFINSGDYPLEQYKEFYEFVKKIIDIESNCYIVTKKQD